MPERILITMREPYDKDFYRYNENELSYDPPSQGVSAFFQVTWNPEDYDTYSEAVHGFIVLHRGGRDFYPWAAIQEIDFMNVSEARY